MSVQLEHWYQWKARCAVNLCDEQIREELTRMLIRMMRKLVWIGRQREALDVKEAVTLFDSYNAMMKRGDVRYQKEWMLEPVAAVEADLEHKLAMCNRRAKGVMKNAVSHFVRGECNHAKTRKALMTRSLNEAHAGKEGSPVPMMDALLKKSARYLGQRVDELSVPGTQPASAAAEAEFLEIAEGLADEMWREMQADARSLMLAMALNLPMTHDPLLEALNVAQATLYDRRKAHAVSLMKKITTLYPEDDREQHFLLGGMVQQKLHEIALDQIPLPEWAVGWIDKAMGE